MTTQPSAQESVRALLLPLQNGHFLLPHSVVQEIVVYGAPEPVDEAPDWLLGTMKWRRWDLPLISAERLLGQPYEAGRGKSFVAVCNLLTGNDRRPCVGIVTHGVPRLVRVGEAALVAMPESTPSQ